MDISPTTAISNSLIGDMIVHREEFIFHFCSDNSIFSIVIGNSYPFHQIKISFHLDSQLSQHILIPIGYHPFISFRSTYHKNRYSGYLTVFIRNIIKLILLTNRLNLFLCQRRRSIHHLPETVLYQLHFLSLPFTYRSQLDIRLQQRMFIDHKPVICRSRIHKRNLQISRLLAGIDLCCGNQMIDKKFSFHIRRNHAQFIHLLFGNTLHIPFITNPCGTPTLEIDTERKRGTYFSVLQELKFYFFILRLFVIYPYDKCGKK